MISALILSKDRSMQLDCMWRSLVQNCNGFFDKTIFQLATSDKSFLDGYNHFLYKHQDINRTYFTWENGINFKNLLKENLEYLKKNDTKYILGLTDDTILWRKVNCNLQSVIESLWEKDTLFLSLRLGRNTTIQDCVNNLPMDPIPVDTEHTSLCGNEFLFWNFKNGPLTQNPFYPFSLDGHIYDIDDLLNLCHIIPFENLRQLEGNAIHYWKNVYWKSRAICFETSVAVNCDLNVVQPPYQSHSPYFITPETMNKMYLNGYRMDLNKMLEGVTIQGSHQMLKPVFNKENNE